MKELSRALEILKRVLDTHTSRKNVFSQGYGPQCDCDDCKGLRKAIKLIERGMIGLEENKIARTNV